VGGLQRTSGIRAGLRQRQTQRHRVVVDADALEPLASLVHTNDTDRRRCRSIPTYCRSTGPPRLEVLVQRAQVLARSDDPETGRILFALAPDAAITPPDTITAQAAGRHHCGTLSSHQISRYFEVASRSTTSSTAR
jgi:hypothetical protein